MKKRFCILCAGLLLAGMLTGCTEPAPPAPTATPAATATPAPTAAPAPTANPDNTPERFWELAAHDQYLSGVITDCQFTDYPGESWIAFTADDGQEYRVEGPLGREHEGLLPFHSVYSYSGKESDECQPGWQVLVYYEDTLTDEQTTITRPKDIFLFFPRDAAGPEEQLFTTEYELGVLRKNFDAIQNKAVFTPDEAMGRVAEYLGLQVEAQSPSPGVTQYTDGSHTLSFQRLWYNSYYQLDREAAFRANTDLAGWAAQLDDPDFPGEEALTRPYLEYEILDRQGDGQNTSYYVSISGEVSTTQTTLTPSAFGQETYAPLFLTEEQQDLFQKAAKFQFAFFSLPDNIQQFPQFQPLAENNWVVIQDGYSLYQNSYEEFSDLAHSVFTQDYLDSLGPLYTEKFVDRDGRLATSTDRGLTRGSLPGARRPVLENYPDLFRLEYQDEETIEFTLISHYDRNWQNYTGEDGMDIYTAEYPIRMVNTDDGWRIDEFHTTEYG